MRLGCCLLVRNKNYKSRNYVNMSDWSFLRSCRFTSTGKVFRVPAERTLNRDGLYLLQQSSPIHTTGSLFHSLQKQYKIQPELNNSYQCLKLYEARTMCLQQGPHMATVQNNENTCLPDLQTKATDFKLLICY